MFTGLIQQICTVKALSKSGDTAALTIDLQQLAEQTKIGLPPRLAPAAVLRQQDAGAEAGDSIAINGVCLTVAKLTGTLATFDLSAETLAKTNLGALAVGSKVNVELAMQADGRFGGHFVLGHIDGTATIRKIKKKGDFVTITFNAPKDLLGQMIPKGSVAVDGISLTIAELNAEGFTVAIIPQTLQKTTLGTAKISQTVNVEIDIITKTVKKHLDKLSPSQNGLTIEGLRQQGF
ncbi:MAG: riboflavin synthase [Sedimentisphaerales bacterium]|nr:riboflavin synthase [Sedimentisphaerales bacterium]